MRGLAARCTRAWFVAALVAVALGTGCRTTPPVAIAPPPPAPFIPALVATPALPTPTPVAAVEIPKRDDVHPPLVRVLLQAPANSLFPELGRRFACVAGSTTFMLRGPLTARVVGGFVAIQVGAFADPGNANAALARLREAGIRGEVRGDGETLRRLVALGSDGEAAGEFSQRLVEAGFTDQKQLGVTAGGSVVLAGESGSTVSGERIRVVPFDPEPVRVGAKALRGEFEVRPGVEGVAVINVLSLEEYLRGVVPAEMGPRAFPALEALKAQAVAARTYAVAHLGDHAGDGYDLCDSQSCQVYEGATAEHPLTDRAVAETAGEIVAYQGRPIDAMYHSTCAGHTEDGGAVFPPRGAPYLKGVACVCDGDLTLGAPTSAGHWLAALSHLEEIGKQAALALGVPPRPAPLAARLVHHVVEMNPRELAMAFGLGEAPLLLRQALGNANEESLERLLDLYRLPLPASQPGTPRTTVEMALVVRMAQLTGRVQVVSGRLLPSPVGLALVTDGSEAPHRLSGQEVVLERRGERWRKASVRFPPGSPGTLWCVEDRCPVIEVEPLDAADTASAWNWWARELSLEEIGRRLGLAGVRSVRVTRRGASGRALAVAVDSSDGSRELLGLPFRRALELPDTLFITVARGNGAGATVRFLGRGWGHGVGMCQNGAFGLARGGATYVKILKTYYTGVEVTRWEGEKP
jgi:stage II sporulation protein D